MRRSGHQVLAKAFRECAKLYNAALEHWQTAWKHGHSVSLYEQYGELTAIRHGNEYWGSVSIGIGVECFAGWIVRGRPSTSATSLVRKPDIHVSAPADAGRPSK